MARPTKSAKLLTECSQTKAEIAERIENETRMRGDADKLKPPAYLNAKQKRIYKHIVASLESAELLGNLDIYLLEQASVCIDRMQDIEKAINKSPELMYNRNVIATRNSYTKDFLRYCNELSLSPQSRAKLANINMMAKKEKEDPLLKILKGGELKRVSN